MGQDGDQAAAGARPARLARRSSAETAPVVLDLGCGNGRFTLASARGAAGPRSFLDRRAARRDPLRDPSRQSKRSQERSVRGQGRADLLEFLCRRRHGRRDPPLSSPTLSRRAESTSSGLDAAGACPRARARFAQAACSSSRPTIPTTGVTCARYCRHSSTSANIPVPGPTPPKAAPAARSSRAPARPDDLPRLWTPARRPDAEESASIAGSLSPSAQSSAPAAPGATWIAKNELIKLPRENVAAGRMRVPLYPMLSQPPISGHRPLRHVTHSFSSGSDFLGRICFQLRRHDRWANSTAQPCRRVRAPGG